MTITIDKAANYGARAGETIAGNLARGGDGKFTSAGNANAKPVAKPTSTRSQRTRKPARTKKTEAQRQAEKQAKRNTGRSTVFDAVKRQGGLEEDSFYALMDFADGKDFESDLVSGLASSGLVELDREGKPRLSSAGRNFIARANAGDTRGAKDALSRGKDRVAAQAEREQKRQAAVQRRAERERRRQARKPSNGKRAILQNRLNTLADGRAFSVVKGADGRYRWILASSNAFRDKDQEIVSSKALEADVARADADGDYGPLLWWHEESLPLGQCDFNAMHGRFLIESGTFRSEPLGAAIASKARELEASIQFLHGGKGSDGDYSTIRRTERSLTPPGMARNPWTRLTVSKESPMLREKLTALKSLLGPENAPAVDDVLTDVSRMEKALEAQGIVSKADEPEPEAKADQADMAGETMEDEPAEEASSYFSPEELSEIVAAVSPAVAAAVVEQLAPMLNIESKLNGYVTEMKALIGGGNAKKADEIEAEQVAQQARDAQVAQLQATQKAQQDTLAATQAKLQELLGEQPSAFYRASQDSKTILPEGHALKSQMPQPDPMDIHFQAALGSLQGM